MNKNAEAIGASDPHRVHCSVVGCKLDWIAQSRREALYAATSHGHIGRAYVHRIEKEN